MVKPWTCRNPPHASKDKLTNNAPGALIKGSGTSTSTSVVSKTLTLASALALASAPGLPGRYTDKNL